MRTTARLLKLLKWINTHHERLGNERVSCTSLQLQGRGVNARNQGVWRKNADGVSATETSGGDTRVDRLSSEEEVVEMPSTETLLIIVQRQETGNGRLYSDHVGKKRRSNV